MSDICGGPGGDRDSLDKADEAAPEHLRELFHRKTLAGERHRAAVARALGMHATEAAALAHLAQHGQLTPGQLGNLVGLTSGGTTALINRLLQSGHIVRHPHPHDRRSSLLTASNEVLERAEELYAPLVADMDALAERLPIAQRVVIGEYLTQIAELSEHHASRLHLESDAEPRGVAAAPAPGLWA